MENEEFEGFRKDGDRIMKGAKAIGKVHGDEFLQEKIIPRHYLKKHKGFGVSIGLLNLLLALGVLKFNIKVVRIYGKTKTTIGIVNAKVIDLINGKMIHYPGFDEQRVLFCNLDTNVRIVQDKGMKIR